MDQVKEILKQLIHYRFWIAVGLAALFPMIGYFAGAGTLRDETTKKAAEIKGAKDGVAPFTAGEVKNTSFTNVVKAKTDVLNRNVDETWQLLYDRQAPLLDWPESVQDYFPKWGRKWPEEVDRNEVDRATRFYMRDYDAYVHKVYATARPFDYEEGTGVVVTPTEAELLAPSKFDINKPPRLGNVWDAQEKLWLQRTVLDVIAQVNKNAKDWSGAQVKQILALQVGSAASQDQKSLVAGEALEKAPAVLAEGEEDPDAETTDSSGYGGYGGKGGIGDGGMMTMAPGFGTGGGSSSGGGGAADAGPIKYITTENPSTQFRLYPVHAKLLVDQNYIPELLAAFQNSPMTIDVREVSIQRPPMRITKPTKGSQNMFGGMMGMMGGYEGGMPAGMGGMGMFGGYGGMMAGGEGGGRGMAGGYGGMMPGGMAGGYGGMMGGAQNAARKGISLREEQKQKKREAESKKKDETKKGDEEPKYEIYDPYADIVMVDIYGQARLYNAPPEPEAIEPSESAADAAADPAAEMPAEETKKPDGEPVDPPADPGAMPAEETKKPDAPAEEPTKPDAPAEETKKPDAPAEETKKPDAPAEETKKPDAPSAEPGGQPAPEQPAKPDQPAGEPKADAPQQR